MEIFHQLPFFCVSDGQEALSLFLSVHVGFSICVIISIITPVNMHLPPVFLSD